VNKNRPYTLLEETIPPAILKDEVHRWAERLGVEPKEIHIRSMKRKWASCSSSGRVTFDTDLLREPTGFRSEVIVHELLHLKVANHGKLFRSLMRAHLSEPQKPD
jgi:predicted metal-dependent hydrolase